MRRLGILIVIAGLFAVLSIRTGAAQAQDKPERKIVSRVAPFYPEMAKRMNLGGLVKLQVVVAPNGRVKSAKPMGGSPILIQAATEAVQKWRFEVAPQETTEAVQVVFELPH